MTKEDQLAPHMDENSEKYSDGAQSHGKGTFRENPEHVPVEVLQQQGSPPHGMVFTIDSKERQCSQCLLLITPSHLASLQSSLVLRKPSEHLHPNALLFTLPSLPRPWGTKPHSKATAAASPGVSDLLSSSTAAPIFSSRVIFIDLSPLSEGRGVTSAQRGIHDAKLCSVRALNGALHLFSPKITGA